MFVFICSLNFVLIYSVLFTPLSTANPLPNHFFAIFCEISDKIGACHDKECDKMAESDRIKDSLKVVTAHFFMVARGVKGDRGYKEFKDKFENGSFFSKKSEMIEGILCQTKSGVRSILHDY